MAEVTWGRAHFAPLLSPKKLIIFVQVQKGAMVAAGSLVTLNTTVPTGEIWAGNPARKLRELDTEEAEFILQSAVNYSALARIHAAENAKTHEEVEVSCLHCTK